MKTWQVLIQASAFQAIFSNSSAESWSSYKESTEFSKLLTLTKEVWKWTYHSHNFSHKALKYLSQKTRHHSPSIVSSQSEWVIMNDYEIELFYGSEAL